MTVISRIAVGAALTISGSLMTSPVRADWRKELGTFRVGVIEAEAGRLSPEDIDKVRATFGTALGMPVEIFLAKDFPSLIDAQASSRVEYAMYSAGAYATAWLACQCVEPLAAPLGADGSIGTRTALVADQKLTPSALATSKGVGVPSGESISTFGVALASFVPNGIKLTGNEPWLQTKSDLAEALVNLKAGTLDGLFAAVPSSASQASVLEGASTLASELGKTGRTLRTLWLSETLPYGPHAVRKNLAPEAKALLLKMLIGLQSADPDVNDILLPEGTDKFTAISHSAYGLALDATKALAARVSTPKP
jgi:phosphonate transport system substrate-binding protein